jgi:hypothetical protein
MSATNSTRLGTREERYACSWVTPSAQARSPGKVTSASLCRDMARKQRGITSPAVSIAAVHMHGTCMGRSKKGVEVRVASGPENPTHLTGDFRTRMSTGFSTQESAPSMLTFPYPNPHALMYGTTLRAKREREERTKESIVDRSAWQARERESLVNVSRSSSDCDDRNPTTEG